MSYNQYEKDLEALESLPSVKNPKRSKENLEKIATEKARKSILKSVDKRITDLENEVKRLIILIDRIIYRQTRTNKQLTNREADGNYTQQKSIPE